MVAKKRNEQVRIQMDTAPFQWDASLVHQSEYQRRQPAYDLSTIEKETC